MISAAASGSARLLQGLRLRAERIAGSSELARRLQRRRHDRPPVAGANWRDATALWPEFTADDNRS